MSGTTLQSKIWNLISFISPCGSTRPAEEAVKSTPQEIPTHYYPGASASPSVMEIQPKKEPAPVLPSGLYYKTGQKVPVTKPSAKEPLPILTVAAPFLAPRKWQLTISGLLKNAFNNSPSETCSPAIFAPADYQATPTTSIGSASALYNPLPSISSAEEPVNGDKLSVSSRNSSHRSSISPTISDEVSALSAMQNTTSPTDSGCYTTGTNSPVSFASTATQTTSSINITSLPPKRIPIHWTMKRPGQWVKEMKEATTPATTNTQQR